MRSRLGGAGLRRSWSGQEAGLGGRAGRGGAGHVPSLSLRQSLWARGPPSPALCFPGPQPHHPPDLVPGGLGLFPGQILVFMKDPFSPNTSTVWEDHIFAWCLCKFFHRFHSADPTTYAPSVLQRDICSQYSKSLSLFPECTDVIYQHTGIH